MQATRAGGASNGIQPIGNRWEEAKLPHINFLELGAIWLALNSYFRNSCNAKHVKIFLDNSTAISYVNNIGGKQRNTRVPPNTGSLSTTFGKPYKKPSDDTFARWIKTELVNAGIDNSVFKAHSFR